MTAASIWQFPVKGRVLGGKFGMFYQPAHRHASRRMEFIVFPTMGCAHWSRCCRWMKYYKLDLEIEICLYILCIPRSPQNKTGSHCHTEPEGFSSSSSLSSSSSGVGTSRFAPAFRLRMANSRWCVGLAFIVRALCRTEVAFTTLPSGESRQNQDN